MQILAENPPLSLVTKQQKKPRPGRVTSNALILDVELTDVLIPMLDTLIQWYGKVLTYLDVPMCLNIDAY